jgi:hypothetical protein
VKGGKHSPSYFLEMVTKDIRSAGSPRCKSMSNFVLLVPEVYSLFRSFFGVNSHDFWRHFAEASVLCVIGNCCRVLLGVVHISAE